MCLCQSAKGSEDAFAPKESSASEIGISMQEIEVQRELIKEQFCFMCDF
jgi:hypothetical protein